MCIRDSSQGAYTAILPEGVPKWAFFIFQTVFCATAATIVSGAMAERTKFISYCIYSAVISAVVYPISVSYTHLDVYKRQWWDRGIRSGGS